LASDYVSFDPFASKRPVALGGKAACGKATGGEGTRTKRNTSLGEALKAALLAVFKKY
jgi:hypothetical protein